MATHHVDFEIVGVINTVLVVRFRVADKHLDVTINWDGTSEVFDAIRMTARGVIMQILQPPPPTFEKLLTQVGRQGHVDIDMAQQFPPLPPLPPLPPV